VIGCGSKLEFGARTAERNLSSEGRKNAAVLKQDSNNVFVIIPKILKSKKTVIRAIDREMHKASFFESH